MALLADDLSLWEIGFRMSSLDAATLRLFVPLDVRDNFRNLCRAIIRAEIECENVTLEKRQYSQDEKQNSIYYWLDDIYATIGGKSYSRAMLKHILVSRYSFKLWCERMSIPLPEFWFPPGWSLEYQLPEDQLPPGYWFQRRHWTREEWEAWHSEQETLGRKTTYTEAVDDSSNGDAKKLRPSQAVRIACQQIASSIWRTQPDRTIASIVRDEIVQKLGGAEYYADETVREWIKEVAPANVSGRRGRPRKNGDKDVPE